MEITLYEKLKNAYDATTQNYNRFEEAIKSIKWDDVYSADGEMYYEKGDFCLVVENINPFKEKRKPSILFKTSYIVF